MHEHCRSVEGERLPHNQPSSRVETTREVADARDHPVPDQHEDSDRVGPPSLAPKSRSDPVEVQRQDLHRDPVKGL